ncbi:unnamed protein product, partial [Amoebophrya sp. A25]|eukprot:GSA25T00009104001.1
MMAVSFQFYVRPSTDLPSLFYSEKQHLFTDLKEKTTSSRQDLFLPSHEAEKMLI